MEMLRFKDRFNYQLEVAEDLVLEETDIPPMILQPIVENAIKHGIFHLDENILGKVKIKIGPSVHPANHKKAIQIEVTDNGVGLKVKNDFLKSQHKKSALFITIKRLHHCNKTESQFDNMFYEVLEPHGTKITLYIIT
jgi:LytS/YehU family sensor histidine kinase